MGSNGTTHGPHETTEDDLESAYCEARAKRYVGAERVRYVADTELEVWLRDERAAAREELLTRLACVRALLRHLEHGLEGVVEKLEAAVDERPTPSIHAADVPHLVTKASTVFDLWRAYASEELYGETFAAEMDRMDLDLLEDAMSELGDALRPFTPR